VTCIVIGSFPELDCHEHAIISRNRLEANPFRAPSGASRARSSSTADKRRAPGRSPLRRSGYWAPGPACDPVLGDASYIKHVIVRQSFHRSTRPARTVQRLSEHDLSSNCAVLSTWRADRKPLHNNNFRVFLARTYLCYVGGVVATDPNRSDSRRTTAQVPLGRG
jgi:hypothetical protein